MQDILIKILSVTYLFLPAYIANSTPLIAKHFQLFHKLNIPIDSGFKINNKRILGSHKTWRGLIVGILTGGIIFGSIQYVLSNSQIFKQNLILIYPYQNYIDTLVFSTIMSFAALFGDLLKSFLKRRLSIKEGDTFLFFDQTDYLIGVFILIKPLYDDIPLDVFLIFFVSGFLLHLLSGVFSKLTGMKDNYI